MNSGKNWNGSIYPKKGRGPFTVKFRRWEDRFKKDPWARRKGFTKKSSANSFLRAAKREYDLKQAGLHNPHQEQRQLPIKKHIDDFKEHVRSGRTPRPRKNPEKHVNLVVARLTKAFADMSARSLGDLTLDKATRFLNKQVASGAAVKTRNDYMAALKQFGRWLEESDRVAKNPMAALRKLPPSEREHRQALTPEQVHHLASAAIQRTLQSRARPMNRAKHIQSAKRRALTVLLGFLAGLRNNELANLRWSMIGDEVIELPAEITKSGRLEFVPLHDGLRDVLRNVRRERGVEEGRTVAGSDLVVGYLDKGEHPTLPVHIAERIREDAEWIKLPTTDEAGRVIDLHAMRTSLANALDENVPDGIVGAILRHKPVGVTRKHYRRTDAVKLRAFINEIPPGIAMVPGLADPNSFDAATRSVDFIKRSTNTG